MWELDPACAAVLRLCVALLLFSSLLHKMRDLAAFRVALEGYALLPAVWVAPAARLVTGAEAVLGIAILLPVVGSYAAMASAALLTTYTAAIAINVNRGRTSIDCGCGGPAGRVPLSGALIVRNGILVLVSLLAALPTAARSLHALDGVIIGAAATTFALLYTAADTALANGAHWRDAHARGAVGWQGAA